MPNAAPSPPRGSDPWSDLLAPHRPGSLTPPSPNPLRSKRILITGCGGSIGSALTLAAHAASPASLTLLDTSEAALYHLDRTLHSLGSLRHVPLLGSVADPRLLDHLFTLHRPQIILHAAALKHVPLMEQNPFAAIATNALGTLTLAQAALAHRSLHLLLVSTDKAVTPHSIMGASKRIAELVLLAHGTSSTRMSAVRLCNVIGSQGSVLPLFLDQIARHLPLTVTHPEAQRHCITLDRALAVLLAALHSPSPAALLVPDFPPPIRILDLARHLLEAHASASPITFTGLRPGDKLTEALLSADEHRSARPVLTHPSLYAVETPTPSPAILHAALTELRNATRAFDLPRLLRTLQTLVPDYQPGPTLTSAAPHASEVPA